MFTKFKGQKEEEMAKVEPVKSVSKNEPEVDLTKNAAFGLSRHPEGWAITKVGFDIESGNAKVLDVVWTGLSREDAEFNFKVSVGKYFSEVQ